MTQKLLTISQAARSRGVSRQTIYNAMSDHRLTPVASPHGPLIKAAQLAKMQKRKSPGRPRKTQVNVEIGNEGKE